LKGLDSHVLMIVKACQRVSTVGHIELPNNTTKFG